MWSDCRPICDVERVGVEVVSVLSWRLLCQHKEGAVHFMKEHRLLTEHVSCCGCAAALVRSSNFSNAVAVCRGILLVCGSGIELILQLSVLR